MEIIKHKVYRDDINFENKHFIMCNFSQENYFTEINVTNCIFEDCNLCNCIINNSNQKITCNQAQFSIEETESQIITKFYDIGTREIIHELVEDK